MKDERSATRWMAIIWSVAAVAVTGQQLLANRIDNFRIFSAASLHLIRHQDLYAAYPGVQVDFYKYSPTFALLFLPFAVLPTWLGLLLWNLLGAAALFLSLGALLPPRMANVARAVVFLDMVGSLQNAQSNALVAALMIWAFVAYERERAGEAALATTVGASIKIFPLAGASFALFHPKKPRAALLMVVAAAVLLAAPLVATSPHELLDQYRSWRAIEGRDAADLNYGYSVMTILRMLLRTDWPNWPMQLLGAMALIAPVLARRERWSDAAFRRLYLCSVLVFCVIFNHQAESPSFIIAVAGAAIWFASLERRSRWDWTLFALLVVGTILSSSDAMPRPLRRDLFAPYRLKTVPCLLLWLELQRLLWSSAKVTSRTPDTSSRRDTAAESNAESSRSRAA